MGCPFRPVVRRMPLCPLKMSVVRSQQALTSLQLPGCRLIALPGLATLFAALARRHRCTGTAAAASVRLWMLKSCKQQASELQTMMSLPDKMIWEMQV